MAIRATASSKGGLPFCGHRCGLAGTWAPWQEPGPGPTVAGGRGLWRGQWLVPSGERPELRWGSEGWNEAQSQALPPQRASAPHPSLLAPQTPRVYEN